MNTNDFYKELFEKYALDEEKIRRNAIKAARTPAWQRAVSAHWKSAVGAAAAVAVTIGAVAYTVGNNTGYVSIDSSESLPSALQRIHDAELNYINAAVEDESKTNFYVTFLDKVCYRDMAVLLSAVPDSDDIDIECLYLDDSTVIRGKEDIEAYAEANAEASTIAAVKLYAPLRCYRDLTDLSKVYIAELASDEINDDTFSPIDFDDEDPLSDAYDFISTTALPESTTTPFSFETTTETEKTTLSATEAATSGTTVVVTDEDADTTEPPAETTTAVEETDDPEYIETEDEEPVETESTPETEEPEVTTVSVTSEETYTTTSETAAETTVSVTEISNAPEIGLLTQIYQLNVENALETLLVGEHAIVLTRGEVYVYSIGGVIEIPPSVYEISSPKIAHSDNSAVIITGCGASGRRNTVMTIDLISGVVAVKDCGESFGEAEIGTVHYSSSDNRYILKAVSDSTTYLYELTINGDIQLRPLIEMSGAVSPAGCKNGKLWFTAMNGAMKYTLYSFDCNNGQLFSEADFGTVCKVRRSKTFESFFINASDPETDEAVTYVFDTTAGKLIPLEINCDASIAVSGGVIYIGTDGKNYTVSTDGTLTETSASVNYTYKPYSSYSVISADAKKVVIAENNGWN
ncbi:MAG: hypothetical protein IK093_09700 [Ruminiclostridium sp.]|nr:hypothetical protein [Ruminiclostridium sp.]